MNMGDLVLQRVPVHLTGQGEAWSIRHSDFIGPRLETALRPFARWIRHVTVWLEDVKGPRGGVDQRCRITLHLKRRGPVTVEAQATTRYAAIAKATVRVRNVLSRRLEKNSRPRRELSWA